MNFDIKDVKSWANRNDVKVGDKGYFADSVSVLDNKVSTDVIDVIKEIDERYAFCFNLQNSNANYCFFLPLDAVKKDKPKEKKYRPVKNIRELSDAVHGKDWTVPVNIGEELLVRNKHNKHRIKVLITQLGFDNNLELLSINNKASKVWLENYEVMSVNGKFMPFGVEVEDE